MTFQTMNPLDDIIDLGRTKSGTYVVVVDSSIPMGRAECRSFTGWPVEVVGLELPFLVVFDGKITQTLDLRQFKVKRVPKKYAHLMIDAALDEGRLHMPEEEPEQAKDDGHQRCVRCGTRLVERLRKDAFVKWCPQCDRYGEKVPS